MTARGARRAVLDRIAGLVASRTGFVVTDARRDDLASAVHRLATRTGAWDLGELHDRLDTDASLLDELLAEITVTETYFLRDPSTFDFIRHEIIPAIGLDRGPDHAIRVWSAGCASGEEAYSLAIVLEECGAGTAARVLGTDISRRALAVAKRRAYGTWSLRGADDAFVTRYFHRRKDRFVLDERIAGRVVFEYLNLAADTYPSLVNGTSRLDLVLCRNVLIYFNRDTIAAVARRLYASLADHGWLVLGPSDPLLSDYAPFEVIVTRSGIIHRRGESGARVAVAVTSPSPVPPVVVAPPPAPEPPPVSPLPEPPPAPPAVAVLPDDIRPAPPTSADPDVLDHVARIRHAMSIGDYRQAIALAEDADDPNVSALRVRAMANLAGADEACAAAAAAAQTHPLAAELHFLHAVLLVDGGRDAEAEPVARRAIYLDPSLALAHFLLGGILSRRGDRRRARQAYHTARNLCIALQADAAVPLGDGQRAGRVAEAAAAQIDLLEEAS